MIREEKVMIMHFHEGSDLLARMVIRITCGGVKKCSYLYLWPYSNRFCGRKLLWIPEVRGRLDLESPVMQLLL